MTGRPAAYGIQPEGLGSDPGIAVRASLFSFSFAASATLPLSLSLSLFLFLSSAVNLKRLFGRKFYNYKGSGVAREKSGGRDDASRIVRATACRTIATDHVRSLNHRASNCLRLRDIILFICLFLILAFRLWMTSGLVH